MDHSVCQVQSEDQQMPSLHGAVSLSLKKPNKEQREARHLSEIYAEMQGKALLIVKYSLISTDTGTGRGVRGGGRAEPAFDAVARGLREAPRRLGGPGPSQRWPRARRGPGDGVAPAPLRRLEERPERRDDVRARARRLLLALVEVFDER